MLPPCCTLILGNMALLLRHHFKHIVLVAKMHSKTALEYQTLQKLWGHQLFFDLLSTCFAMDFKEIHYFLEETYLLYIQWCKTCPATFDAFFHVVILLTCSRQDNKILNIPSLYSLYPYLSIKALLTQCFYWVKYLI